MAEDVLNMRILLAHNSTYFPASGGGDKSNRLLMEALVSAAPEGPVATLGWLRTSQALAEAQLASGRYAAASQTAADTLIEGGSTEEQMSKE